MKKTMLLFVFVALTVLSCQQPSGGGSPFTMNQSVPQKKLQTNQFPVEMICYVDVEHYNPLNVKDYVLAAGVETPFFNYAVLAYAYLSRDKSGYTHLELSPALKYILDNSPRYVKPLHEKGIQVLVEVRSGIFSNTEDGIGLGLGTMDMAGINEFIKELKSLVNHYGIDGFDFNDIGGGAKAYPPLTRNLTQFRSDKPLYPDSLFKDTSGNEFSPKEVEELLWIEGGSNFSNFILWLNEELKETYTTVYKNGSNETSETLTIERSILVRSRNHGRHLLSQLRMAYIPDAYSGADPKVPGNLKYIIHDVPYNDSMPHPSLWNEVQGKDVGSESDDKYAPLTIDLADRKDADTARRWANTFLLIDPDGSRFDADNHQRYGAMYFTNLQPQSAADMEAYLTYFSRVLFGHNTLLASRPGAGDYQKPR